MKTVLPNIHTCESFALLENRLDTANSTSSHLFWEPLDTITATHSDTLDTAFKQLSSCQSQGYFLVGYCAYECGFAFEPKLQHLLNSPRQTPLLSFTVYKQHRLLSQADVSAWLNTFQPKDDAFFCHHDFSLSRTDYHTQLKKIKQAIYNGETYQVNFTGKYHFQHYGHPIAIYQQCRTQQAVEYSALLYSIDKPILSFSPELFFKKEGEKIITKPMKGTARRGKSPEEDEAQRRFLQNDTKNRAENVMIVDLLRNDLSKFAKPKSVKVPNLFDIETYATLHQMTSTISATIEADTPFKTILSHLFPCGSITGAPKIRTMEIIHETEKMERGIYTGAIGMVMPNNDMCFNVPIRTIVLQANNKGEMGIGSGITHASNIDQEYEETLLKAKFLIETPVNFELFECFRYDAKHGYRYLKDHLNRLAQSADTFYFQFDREKIESALHALTPEGRLDKAFKIKLTLKKNGSFTLKSSPITPSPTQKPQITIANMPVPEQHYLLQHKTTAPTVRKAYDTIFQQYQQSHGSYDVVFTNRQQEVIEASRHNVFIEKNGVWYTPPIEVGCLPGIMRQKLLEDKRLHTVTSRITLEDLKQADRIWLCNSVRGCIEVTL